MLLPAPLKRGSRIAVVSPSGPVATTDRLSAGVDKLRAYGFEVDLVGPTSSKVSTETPEYFAASDTKRQAAMRKALTEADAVWFSRGGYGAARVLDGNGWDRHGPWLVGFSDATATLWARYARGIGGGIHGPVVNGLSSEPTDSVDRLLQILRHQTTEPLALQHLSGSTSLVSAPIIAGNLCVATSLIGTPFMPLLDGHVVVFEDVSEPPYKVDRMLTQWRQSGLLNGVVALIFGTFDSTPNPLTYEVLVERTEDLGIPIYSCARIGHHGETAPLVIGQSVRISRGKLTQ
jgi:muramoyltetrapeptide carboxypeptidase